MRAARGAGGKANSGALNQNVGNDADDRAIEQIVVDASSR